MRFGGTVRRGGPVAYLPVVFLIAVLTLAWSSAGFGEARSQTAAALFHDGKFLEAAKLARTENTAQGLALAARAMLMHAGYIARGAAAEEELKDAVSTARAARAKDPRNVEAMLQLSIGLGYLSRQEGKMKAHADGYGEQAKSLIKKAIKLSPNSGWAHAAYGGWNAEVVARGGSFLASVVYGASRKKAQEAFDKAISLDPRNPTIRVEYAKALIRMHPKDPDLDTARRELEAAEKLPPDGEVDRILQAQGRKLLAALNTDSPNGLDQVVREMTPFER